MHVSPMKQQAGARQKQIKVVKGISTNASYKYLTKKANHRKQHKAGAFNKNNYRREYQFGAFYL